MTCELGCPNSVGPAVVISLDADIRLSNTVMCPVICPLQTFHHQKVSEALNEEVVLTFAVIEHAYLQSSNPHDMSL